MGNLWEDDSGNLLEDGSGNLYDCADCPCDCTCGSCLSSTCPGSFNVILPALNDNGCGGTGCADIAGTYQADLYGGVSNCTWRHTFASAKCAYDYIEVTVGSVSPSYHIVYVKLIDAGSGSWVQWYTTYSWASKPNCSAFSSESIAKDSIYGPSNTCSHSSAAALTAL